MNEMNSTELLVKKTEENQIRQILLIMKEAQDLEEAEAKVKALLEK